METRQQPAPRPKVAPPHAANPRQFAETARPGVVVRVSVLDERPEDEEKEVGYGHGV
jgi:hypothetical protein